ncbi:MAG: DMT family transporter [Bacteroidetes bacterium]|nr:DMT family transporter [Bacteroidota bacterium]
MEKKTVNTISWAGILITLVGSLFFSTKAVIVKYAFRHTGVDVVPLLALRMLFSLPFYIVMAWLASRNANNQKFTRKQWLAIILLGLFGYYLSSLFDFWGLQYISAGIERLILFLYPTFVLLINAFLFKEKINRTQWLAVMMTYTGIVLAYVHEVDFERNNPQFIVGSLLIFLCAITFAIYIVGSGRVIPEVGATKFTAYAMLFSTAGIFIHFIIAGHYSILNSGTSFIGYGLLIAIIATVIPSWLIATGTKKIGANNVAIISTIGPVSTILQAHFILGEPVSKEQLFGTLLIVMGVLIIGWKPKEKN